ncbi:hypothetical protein F5Y13DRAFT_202952 [Hypoxylon sp. FL1857]|nr:hypothetical protein F5Y13DRAFT_202952 [Hypoxylon sp. FL1857]
MNKLPLEITQRVLCSLDDVHSLRAAALSCPALYTAFTSAEKLITTNVLLRQIPCEVLPEAIVVEASWSIQSDRDDEIERFSRDYLSIRPAPFASLGLADALRLARLHNIVDFLARRLARDALANGPPQVSDESPYESKPTVTFDDFVFEGWGAMSYHYIHNSESGEGQDIISRGLELIYQLATAGSQEEQFRILSNAEGISGNFYVSGDFLGRWLNDFGASPMVNGSPAAVVFSALTAEEKAAYIRRPYCDDNHCSGVQDLWDRAYGNFPIRYLVNLEETLNYRLWGLMFWDRERIPDDGWEYSDTYADDPLEH